MPEISSPSLWRTNPYEFNAYLYLDAPTVVFLAQISTTPAYPAPEFLYGSVTYGAYTDVKKDMTILFGSVPGASDLGRGRIRLNATSAKIYIGRSSRGYQDGEADLTAGTYITVLDDYRVWARIPFIADGLTDVNGSTPPLGTTYKDWDIDITQGYHGYPIVNLGGGIAYANLVDPNTDLITCTFKPDQLSILVSGTSFTGWLWDVADGTITSGSTTTPQITVTFPVGRRYIHLTATDSGGHSTTRHLLVIAAKKGSGYAPIENFTLSPLKNALAGGQTCDITVWSNIPNYTYPDGTTVIVWQDETYGNTTGSLNVISDIIGQTGFEHILFAGYHQTDPNTMDASPVGETTSVTLSCLDVIGRLATLPGFSQEINRETLPTTWIQMQSANMDKYFDYLLFWHSTALFVTDFYWTYTGDTYAFSRLGSDADDLYSQVEKLADNAIGYHLASNQQGMMFIRPDPLLLPLASRTNVSVVSISQADIEHLSFTGQRPPRSHWDRGAAVIASTANASSAPTPLTAFGVAPGRAPGQGKDSNDRNEQLVTDENELYVRMGMRRARENSNLSYLSVRPIWTGNAGVDPAYGQWVTITLTAAYAAQRKITFTSVRGYIRECNTTINVSPEGNTKDVEWILEVETVGLPAVLDPQPVDSNPPVIQPIPTPAPPAPIGDQGSTNPGDAYVTPPGQVAGLTGQEIFAGSTSIPYMLRSFINLTTPQSIAITPGTLTGYAIQQVLVAPIPTTTSLAGYILAYNSSTDTSAVWYAPDISIASPAWSKGADQDGHYSIIRGTDIPGTVSIEGAVISGSGTTYDFTISNYGWTATNYVNSTTTYTAGVGFVCSGTSFGPTENLFAIASLSITPTTPLSVKATFTATGYVGDSTMIMAAAWDDAGGTQGVAAGTNVAATPTLTQTVIIPKTVNTLNVRAQTGSPSSAETGSVTLTKVILSPVGVSVATSTDYGATFSTPQAVGDPSGTTAGFDVSSSSATSYSACSGKVRKATALGGTYSDFINTTGTIAVCVIIPYYRRGSTSVSQVSATNPDVVVALSAADSGGGTLYWVDGATGTKYDITPVAGMTFSSSNCVTTFYGTMIYVFGTVSGTPKLYRGTWNGSGFTWVFVKNLTSPTFIRVRRQGTDLSRIQVYLADNGSMWYSSYGLQTPTGTPFIRNMPSSIITFDTIF